jgi:hypothetical protein
MLAPVGHVLKPIIYRVVIALLLAAGFVFSLAHADGTNGINGPNGDDMSLNVFLDEARIVKLPDRVSTIVVGNPLIADANLQAGGLMVLTGKGYGNTNIIALDRSGNALLEKNIRVHGPLDHVVIVYRGIERETYNCAPKCERRITPGDNQQYFNQTLTQTTVRNSQAAGMGNR